MKSVLQNVCLVAFGLTLALLLSEAVLYLYEDYLLGRQMFRLGIDESEDFNRDFAAADGRPVYVRSALPGLVYGYRPGARLSNGERINSDGFKDYEFSTEKPSGTVRILGLGDSVTFGVGGEGDLISVRGGRWEATYPKLLERLLDGHERCRFEVYNLGVGGYNVAQEVALLEHRALDYQPDVVTIGYVMNDNNIGADAGVWRHFSRSVSRTLDFLKLRFLEARERWSAEDLTQRSLARLHRIARENGVAVLLVVFPTRTPAGEDYPHEQRHRQLESIAAQHGFLFLDLRTAFQGHPHSGIFVADGLHLTQLGHRIAADEVLRTIRSALSFDCQGGGASVISDG